MKRIVKMTFRPDTVGEFLTVFEENCRAITAFDGCRSVELLRSIQEPNTFFTLSEWDSEDDLNAYRNSQLFSEVWAKTKALFTERANAWSLNTVER